MKFISKARMWWPLLFFLSFMWHFILSYIHMSIHSYGPFIDSYDPSIHSYGQFIHSFIWSICSFIWSIHSFIWSTFIHMVHSFIHMAHTSVDFWGSSIVGRWHLSPDHPFHRTPGACETQTYPSPPRPPLSRRSYQTGPHTGSQKKENVKEFMNMCVCVCVHVCVCVCACEMFSTTNVLVGYSGSQILKANDMKHAPDAGLIAWPTNLLTYNSAQYDG